MGEECHIVAREPGGPRGEATLSATERDRYDNLILLCAVHHKLIDDQPSYYNAPRLTKIKCEHEAWVRRALSHHTEERKGRAFPAQRMTTGSRLLQTIGGSYSWSIQTDEVGTCDDAELVGGFLQTVQDAMDLWQDMDAKFRVQTQFDLTNQVQALDAAGFVVYACQRSETLVAGDKRIPNWPVAYVVVLAKSNPTATENSVDGSQNQTPKDRILIYRA